MKKDNNSILIIGESGVGKTHYGAKVLTSLLDSSCELSMDVMPDNIELFAEAIETLNDGLAVSHTPANIYGESIWQITDSSNRKKNLIWPDYGGEQIINMVASRNIPNQWYDRVVGSSSWIFMLRPSQYRLPEDILTKPVINESQSIDTGSSDSKVSFSDQPRLIELLQILLYLHKTGASYDGNPPKVCFLISCWDELETEKNPIELLQQKLPMLSEFIQSHWSTPIVMGLSALGRNLHQSNKDYEYSRSGPEENGYIVKCDGELSTDVTLPIKYLLDHL